MADAAETEAHSADYALLARTWNDNPSGRLWEALWYHEDGHFYRRTVAPGVFVPPMVFTDAATFWAEFEQERTKFRGARARCRVCSAAAGDCGCRLGGTWFAVGPPLDLDGNRAAPAGDAGGPTAS